jgi:signal transduction histidine kinase
MNLLSKTTIYMSTCIVVIMGVWAVLFYVSMLDEIYDSIDDGLDNYKLLILEKLEEDSTILHKNEFNEGNYSIKALGNNRYSEKNQFSDTLMFMRNEMDFEPVRLLTTDFTYSGRAYQLQVISSMVEEDDLMSDMLYYVIGLYLCIVVSVILLNNFVLRKIWRPFYALLEELKSFNLHSGVPVIPPATNIREFQLLNEAVLQLVTKDINVYKSQREFIENASHELQTPLAVSIGKLELMLEEENQSEHQLSSISTVLNNLDRLRRLNKALILISKIENNQFHDEEAVNFNEIISQRLSEFEDMISYHQIRIIREEVGSFVHTMNRDLAIILISNLVKNAIVHNQKEGTLTIRTTDHSIDISNKSNSPRLNEKDLFKRFYKQAYNRESTGLGLAIAKSICQLSDLDIIYHYEHDHHILSIKKR